MTLDTRIVDSETSTHLHINGEGEASVVVHPHPPSEETITTVPFRQYMTDDGLSTGSNDMTVDGSVTNVVFSVKAQGDRDIYIKNLAVIVADAGSRLNLFGALAELTNGIEFIHSTNVEGDLVLHEAITTNLEFVRMALNTPTIGDGTSAFRADITGGGKDSYMPVIDFNATFGLSWGLRLQKGSKDEIKFIIKDDITGIDQFDVIAYGIKT